MWYRGKGGGGCEVVWGTEAGRGLQVKNGGRDTGGGVWWGQGTDPTPSSVDYHRVNGERDTPHRRLTGERVTFSL